MSLVLSHAAVFSQSLIIYLEESNRSSMIRDCESFFNIKLASWHCMQDMTIFFIFLNLGQSANEVWQITKGEIIMNTMNKITTNTLGFKFHLSLMEALGPFQGFPTKLIYTLILHTHTHTHLTISLITWYCHLV